MVKKGRPTDDESGAEAEAGRSASQLASTIKESAQQIWLAGLGAFSRAQEEGTRVFETLVKEGVGLQKKTQASAGERLGEVSERMSAFAEGMTARAGQQWDRLETIFEARVARAMGRLGVPSKQEFDALNARIDALNRKVAALSRSAAGRNPLAAAAKKAPAKKKPMRRGSAPSE